ncbi:MAG: hypothetical protein ACRD82_22155 [Blastocatellia bacterium]
MFGVLGYNTTLATSSDFFVASLVLIIPSIVFYGPISGEGKKKICNGLIREAFVFELRLVTDQWSVLEAELECIAFCHCCKKKDRNVTALESLTSQPVSLQTVAWNNPARMVCFAVLIDA